MSTIEKHQPAEVATPYTRIARYDQYFDLRTFSFTQRKTKAVVKKHGNKRKPVLVVRRIINYKGQLEKTEVDIKSEELCGVLREINEGVEGLMLTRSPPLADPHLFFHSRAALKARFEEEQSKEVPDTALVADLDVALQFIQEDFAGTIADFERLVSHGEITYDLLWALFTPNTLAYHYHELTEQEQIFLVRSVAYSRRYEDGILIYYVDINCDIVCYDGKSFGMASKTLEITQFEGAQKVQDLVIFPLKYHAGKNAIKDHAISRGKSVALMDKPTYQEISGPAMMTITTSDDKAKEVKFNTYGRVVIDPVAFRTFEPNCSYNIRVYRRLDRGKLTDDELAICSPIALGFCFGVKKWGGFAMDRLREIVWNDEAFNSLVLNPKQKIFIDSLVKQHTRRPTDFDDIVAGKGKGLIGLLSGGPGCGKTLTAEAIADLTRQPLYAVSAGELGTDVTKVDENLTRILELSRTWNAVLLLDEAEVFLQKRSTIDVERNALVSVFLRQLEYYQGILILTTNLLPQCDAAFESRIHFSIHYPDLDFESRKVVWKTFLRRVSKNQKLQPDISEEDIDRLAKRKLNGRQIRNAVSNARSIALETESPFSVAHIDIVLDVVNEWEIAKAAETPQDL